MAFFIAFGAMASADHPLATAPSQLPISAEAMAPKAMKKAMTSGAFVSQVAMTEKFTIPQLVMLKLKHKPARKAGKKMMFGKEVRVAAKPASKVVKAFPAKSQKDSI